MIRYLQGLLLIHAWAAVIGWSPIQSNIASQRVISKEHLHRGQTRTVRQLSALSPIDPLGPEAALDTDESFSSPGPHITFGKSGTKLNWFGALYGILAIALGAMWWAALNVCQLAYQIPNVQETLDPNLEWPIFCGHVWGTTLMGLTNCVPTIRGKEHLSDVEGPVMFVANHASFMDIPFVCVAIGWQNYKMVAKKELLSVPVLGKSLNTAGHVILDRTNRRSQLESFKRGVQFLEDGVHLVVFPEGTRSRTGRLQPFKKGAMKMAEKANVPIVPLSIRNANRIQPPKFCFPVTHSKGTPPVEVVIGSPIYTEGKTDSEVTEEAWNAIAENLQEWQKPLPDTPVVSSKEEKRG